MLKIVLYVMIFPALSLPLMSLDKNESGESLLVGFNFCGAIYQLTRQTIMNCESQFLKKLLSGEISSTKDSKGNYFIERPQYEGIYLVDSLTKGEVRISPSNREKILSFADYFGFEKILKISSGINKPQNTHKLRGITGRSKKKHRSAICPECPAARLFTLGSRKEAEDHLARDHKAVIDSREGAAKGPWNISYHLP